MSNTLEQICETKRVHIVTRQMAAPLSEIEETARAQTPPRGFAEALRQTKQSGRHALITEIKKASPSRGVIRADFDPPRIAEAYETGGATCLSVLTDTPYFQGDDDHLTTARDATKLPVLRKDFMLDPYQITESRAIGADCILLILAALEDNQAAELEDAALEWGMDVLIETHDEKEIERALKLRSPLIGINNRNLKTLEVTLITTERLAYLVPEDRMIICESGVKSIHHIEWMLKEGASAFLVGESLMTQDNLEVAVRRLVSAKSVQA